MNRRGTMVRGAIILLAGLSAGSFAPLAAQEAAGHGVGAVAVDTALQPFQALDVFAVQSVSDPQISPDGKHVVYVRRGFDIMTDEGTSNLWVVNADGSGQRALTTGSRSHGSPRWSPSGDRLAYVSNQDGGSEIWVRWMDTGQEAKLTDLTGSPGSITWSPDGKWIAFPMFVPEQGQPIHVNMPARPQGADWGPPYHVIDYMDFRQNGNPGIVPKGYRHVFIVSADGGAARQLTSGPYNYGSPAWTPDGRSLLVSANRREDAEHEPMDTEVYRVDVQTGALTQLTDRYGPDGDGQPSPDGKLIAYTGFDDQHLGYQVSHLYVMNADGSGKRMVSQGWDRDISSPVWSADGRGLFFSYQSEGNGKVGFIDLNGKVTKLLDNVQGRSIGRPYGGGSFSTSRDGRIAYTLGTPSHPADLAVADRRGGAMERLT
ncbi:MAG TPA: DPP IV N-terminal domain-containing protein, partial [Longimicrobiales bacterium]|nr:DPP IV N-terminal domain-containing protein [Longimicrobiales bacterium]